MCKCLEGSPRAGEGLALAPIDLLYTAFSTLLPGLGIPV